VQSTMLGVVVALVILVLLRPIQRLAQHIAGDIMQGVDETPAYLEARKMEIYRAAVEGTVEDGVITVKERSILERLREKLELSEADAKAVELEFMK